MVGNDNRCRHPCQVKLGSSWPLKNWQLQKFSLLGGSMLVALWTLCERSSTEWSWSFVTTWLLEVACEPRIGRTWDRACLAHFWAHFWAPFWAHSRLTLGSLWVQPEVSPAVSPVRAASATSHWNHMKTRTGSTAPSETFHASAPGEMLTHCWAHCWAHCVLGSLLGSLSARSWLTLGSLSAQPRVSSEVSRKVSQARTQFFGEAERLMSGSRKTSCSSNFFLRPG